MHALFSSSYSANKIGVCSNLSRTAISLLVAALHRLRCTQYRTRRIRVCESLPIRCAPDTVLCMSKHVAYPSGRTEALICKTQELIVEICIREPTLQASSDRERGRYQSLADDEHPQDQALGAQGKVQVRCFACCSTASSWRACEAPLQLRAAKQVALTAPPLGAAAGTALSASCSGRAPLCPSGHSQSQSQRVLLLRSPISLPSVVTALTEHLSLISHSAYRWSKAWS